MERLTRHQSRPDALVVAVPLSLKCSMFNLTACLPVLPEHVMVLIWRLKGGQVQICAVSSPS